MLKALLFGSLSLVAFLGLAAELGFFYFPSETSENLVQLFSLSYENNIPTWYASCLLFTCGLVLGAIAYGHIQTKYRDRYYWTLLSVIFFYLSLDEGVGIHEHLGGHLRLGGIFYFDWVIPAGIAVILLGALFFRFLFRLPAKTRWAFIFAASIYISGALLMELPLGYWTEHHGSHNLVYALIDFVEELLELVGAGLFLLALLRYSHQSQGTILVP